MVGVPAATAASQLVQSNWPRESTAGTERYIVVPRARSREASAFELGRMLTPAPAWSTPPVRAVASRTRQARSGQTDRSGGAGAAGAAPADEVGAAAPTTGLPPVRAARLVVVVAIAVVVVMGTVAGGPIVVGGT